MKYNFDEIVDRSGSNSFKYDLREQRFGTGDVLPMWVADMDLKTPDFIIEAIKERTKHEIFGYSFKPESYYRAIINWLKKRHNYELERQDILDFDGVVPSMDFIINALTEKGDKIILQPPVYYPFFENVKNNGREIIYNQLVLEDDKYVIDFEDLNKQVDSKTTMMILCSPHNPGGRVWTREELTQLSKFCLEKNIIVVSDEIHFDLVFAPNKHIPTASLSSEIAQNTITCISASKTFNIAGLTNSSVIIHNSKIRRKVKQYMSRHHMGMGNIFGNVTTEAAFTIGELWLNELMKYLQGNLDFLLDYFKTYIPQIKPMKPEATYLVWLDCKELGLDKSELKSFMIDAGIGLNDGPVFGPGGEGFQRINIGCPRSLLHEGLVRIEKAIESNL